MTNNRLTICTPLAALEATVGFANLDRDLDAYALRISVAVNASLSDPGTLRAIAKLRANQSADRVVAPTGR